MYKKIILIILILLILFGAGYYIFRNTSFVDDSMIEALPSDNTNTETEYIKKDIINDINIYLININTKELEKEKRSVSLTDLNDNPYITLLDQLKKSSTNSNLITPIPENVQILSATLDKSTLIIDLSNEFVMQDTENKLDSLILKSIVKTLTNLKEVSNIKINIDGNENSKLGSFDLSEKFSNSSFEN